MKKEDYMKLSKERLAELLEERDNTPTYIPYYPQIAQPTKPCWAPDGVCTNPFRDCIGCPKTWDTGGVFTTTTNTIVKKD